MLQKVSTAIYQQAAQQAAQQQQAGAQAGSSDESWSGHPSGDGKTVDVDYKVKDENKKKDDERKK